MHNFESPKHSTDDNNWDMSDVKFTGDDNTADTSATPSEDSSRPESSSHQSESLDIPESDPAETGLDPASPDSVELSKDPAEQAIENVRYWGQAYNNLEAQFIQYRENVNLDDPKSRSDYKRMLRRYEEEIHNIWGYMEDATQAAYAYNRLTDPYSRSEAQDINITPGEEGDTIEASSSAFYSQRMHDLE